MHAIVCHKEQGAIDAGQFAVGVKGTCGTGVDVLDKDSPIGRAVALPQFVAMRWIESREKQGSVDVGQLSREGAAWAVGYVLDKDRPIRGAVRLPEFASVDEVKRREDNRPVNDCDEARQGTILAGIDNLDQRGPAGSAVTPPKLRTFRPVFGGEIRRPLDVRAVSR